MQIWSMMKHCPIFGILLVKPDQVETTHEAKRDKSVPSKLSEMQSSPIWAERGECTDGAVQ